VFPVPIHSAFTVPEVVPLTGESTSVFLRATQRFEYAEHPDYAGERKVVTTQYVYTLAEDRELTAEILSWQWHPGEWPDPHLHERANRKLHIPTGRVAFKQVLSFVLTDLGIEPAKPRDEAMAILDESLRRFRAFRSWS
jgi:hypothetical protein